VDPLRIFGAQVWNLNFTVVGTKQSMSHSFLGLKLLPEIKLALWNTNLLNGTQVAFKGFPKMVNATSANGLTWF
jgi:hypothetical protein